MGTAILFFYGFMLLAAVYYVGIIIVCKLIYYIYIYICMENLLVASASIFLTGWIFDDIFLLVFFPMCCYQSVVALSDFHNHFQYSTFSQTVPGCLRGTTAVMSRALTGDPFPSLRIAAKNLKIFSVLFHHRNGP